MFLYTGVFYEQKQYHIENFVNPYFQALVTKYIRDHPETPPKIFIYILINVKNI